MNKLEKKIAEGLQNTLENHISLKGYAGINEWSKPEYLATINIAKALNTLHSYPGERFIICLEESTKEFSDKCVPEEDWDLFKAYTPELQNTERNGRIDIALYQPDYNGALCVVEVKNFNPQKDLLVLDLKRNLEYFTFSNRAHKSIIKKSYVAYYRQFADTKFKKDLQRDLIRAKEELQGFIEEYNIKSDGVSFRVETFTVYDNLLYPGKYSEEEILNDSGDFYAAAGHFVGVIGVFEKSQI